MWIDDVVKELVKESGLPFKQVEEIVNYQFVFLKKKLKESDKDNPETFKDIYLMHLGTFVGNKRQAYHRIERRLNPEKKNKTVCVKKLISGFDDQLVLPEFIVKFKSFSLSPGDIIVNSNKQGVNEDYLFEVVKFIEEVPTGFVYTMKYADNSPKKETHIGMFAPNRRYKILEGNK